MKSPSRIELLLWEISLVYCSFIWGSTFFLTKLALQDIQPATLVAYRFLLAGALILPVGLIMRKPLLANIKDGALLGFILWILYFSQTVGLKYTSASNSGFITGLFVLFVPLFGWILWKRIPRIQQVFAVLMALAGLWFLTGGIDGINTGDLITLFSASTYALHVLLTDRAVRKGVDILSISLQQFFIVGILSLICVLILKIPMDIGSGFAMEVIVFLTLFPTLSAFFIQCAAQRKIDPVRVSLIFTLEPVFAAFFAWTIGGEQLVPLSAMGGSLIVLAMIISELPGLKFNNGNKNRTIS